MSSNDRNNQSISMTESEIVHEIHSFVKAGKTIIPFSKDHIPFNWLVSNIQAEFVDLANWQAIEEYSPADQTITVQSGIKIEDLANFLNKNEQWVPLPSSEQSTLLDLILTGDIGLLETLHGGLRRHVLGLTLALSNGQLAKTGGKVVKNVSGYDLTRFLIGSYGYFAIPIRAHLRLHALPETSLTILTQSDKLNDVLILASKIASSSFSYAYMDLIDQRLMAYYLHNHLGASYKAKKFVLALQIFGDENVVDFQKKQLEKILITANLEQIIISETNEQKNLLKHLEQISSLQKRHDKKRINIVELALNKQEFLALQEEQGLDVFPFVYRPASSRLRYCLNSDLEQEVLLDNLNHYAQKNKKTLTVAYSDVLHMRAVNMLGKDAQSNIEALNTIKQRLKEQFDPSNSFNPFVQL